MYEEKFFESTVFISNIQLVDQKNINKRTLDFLHLFRELLWER